MAEDIKVVYNSKLMADPDKCVAKSVKSWQDARKYTQIALVATLCAQYHHKDSATTLKRMTAIVQGATGGNQAAIVEWANQMGFGISEEGFQSVPDNETIESLAGTGFTNAKNLHWWTLKQQKPFEGYNLSSQLKALVAKAHKMQEVEDEDKKALIDIDPELLERLESLAA